MKVLYNANAIRERNGRRSGLSSAPLDMEHDNNGVEEWSSKHKHKHINPLAITYLLEASTMRILVCILMATARHAARFFDSRCLNTAWRMNTMDDPRVI